MKISAAEAFLVSVPFAGGGTPPWSFGGKSLKAYAPSPDPLDLDVDGVFDAATITEEALRAGLFDHAEVRVFLVNWADLSMGALKMRRGWFGEVILTQSGAFRTELRGLAQALQQKLGEIYSPECRADLGLRLRHEPRAADDGHGNAGAGEHLAEFAADKAAADDEQRGGDGEGEEDLERGLVGHGRRRGPGDHQPVEYPTWRAGPSEPDARPLKVLSGGDMDDARQEVRRRE